MGFKPSDWAEEGPRLDLLVEQLNDQTKRIRKLTLAFFEGELLFKFPIGEIET